MKYEIKLAAFEGPLDLLLHLIEKNRIDIYDIPMAELTQQYMDYIEESKEFKIEIAAEFLVMAAKLMYIKSRIILPKAKPVVEGSETDSADVLDDPRDELVKRLLEYQHFQKVSKVLTSMLSDEERFVKRAPLRLSQKVLPPQNLSVDKLFRAFITAITVNEEPVIPEVLVSSEVFHVKDKIESILSQLEKHEEIKLSEAVMTNSAGEKIAAFLALLELVKRQKIKVKQVIPFSEISITMNKLAEV
ncbi:MAG: segregation/condensation protein A [Selenomonadaceae bacterium]|nr:segregation/condensation protein A [Selenomonadaceae bacterium]